MVICTAGNTYLDIDAFAGIIGYAELLRAQGIDAAAISTAVPNASIPHQFISHAAIQLVDSYRPSEEDSFVIVDLSGPEFFDSFVDVARITSIIDHHSGYEDYWREKLGDKSRIERVGAACTLVVESWVTSGYIDQMSKHTAKLLAAGILDNTLYFKALVTTDRDREAYKILTKTAELSNDFAEEYFGLCDETLKRDLVTSLKNDSKEYRFPGIDGQVTIGQLATWNGEVLVKDYCKKIEAYGSQCGGFWFVNVLSISDGSSYFVCSDTGLQHALMQLFEVSFNGTIAKASRLWLRKEMYRKIESIRA